jgi:hypothetical protein
MCPHTPVVADDLQTLPFMDLMKQRLQRGTPHIVAAAQQLVLRRIRALATAVRAGEVTVQVSPNGHECKENAASITGSNHPRIPGSLLGH